MNLKQMNVFREVMLTGSVSEAARNLNRTQPAISHTLAMLEDDLGMKLFERRRGRLQPVPEAQYLFEECDTILSRVETVNQNMKRMRSLETGELRIVSMPGPAAILLPRMICEQFGANPDVHVTLLTRSSDAVVQLVSAQQFDIGVADHNPERDVEAALIGSKTFSFDCLCALRSDDPLAGLDIVTPKDLSGKAMAALIPEHQSHRRTREIFEAEKAEWNVRFVGQFFLPLLTYVQSGYAAAIVDPLTAESWRSSTTAPEEIVFRPFAPVVVFEADILTPAYRPDSLLAQAFSSRLESLLQSISRSAIKV